MKGVHPEVQPVLRALKVMMKEFKISDNEELYVLPQPTEYCEQASQKVADNLVMTDAEWEEVHNDEEAVSSQRFINCSSTVTELETIVIDSDVFPMTVDLTHEDDVPPFGEASCLPTAGQLPMLPPHPTLTADPR